MCENPAYCLVKQLFYDITRRELKCEECVMTCRQKKPVGENNDKPTN
jgi:hypothetical protein